MKLDALGQPIVIGNKYGYSTSSGSSHHVVIGKAGKITEHGVTLTFAIRSRYRYGEVRDSNVPTKDVNVSSFMLFPIKD